MDTRWARLLDQYQLDGHVGLTPSFLVGALRNPPGTVAAADQSFDDLRSLLESMRDDRAPYGKVVRIFECHNIQQPVAALSSDHHGTPIAGPCDGPAKLYVWPWFTPDRTVDFEYLLHAIWNHFREPLCQGRFSYVHRTGTFTSFDHHDLTFVDRALRPDEDDA